MKILSMRCPLGKGNITKTQAGEFEVDFESFLENYDTFNPLTGRCDTYPSLSLAIAALAVSLRAMEKCHEGGKTRYLEPQEQIVEAANRFFEEVNPIE